MTAASARPDETLRPAGRLTALLLPLAAGLGGLALVAAMAAAPAVLAGWGIDRQPDIAGLGLFGAAAILMLAGGLLAPRRQGLGSALSLTGSLFWLAAVLWLKSYSGLIFLPFALGGLGALGGLWGFDRTVAEADSRLIYRQRGLVRLTHWIWAISMFFLLGSGLQIFNARPNLYIGQQSGFAFENSILDIYAVNGPNGPVGQTKLFGQVFDTSGVLGMSGTADRPVFTAFPAWATIPSFRDLATGRVIHFFFAWVLVGTFIAWLLARVLQGGWHEIVPGPSDFRRLPRDIIDHARFRFAHTRHYSPLQKLAYFGVMGIAVPLIILTGLTMSPGMNAAWPWLLDIFGGRQTARTIHFIAMLSLVLFFVVHIAMVILAGPINELRSMITGYYRVSPEPEDKEGTP